MQKGHFREDLFYRLYVIPVVLAPLKERKSDIPLLIDYFIENICRAKGRNPVEIAPETLAVLFDHPWPGNIRELRNLIERLVVLNESGTILPKELPDNIRGRVSHQVYQPQFEIYADGVDFNTAVTEYEKDLILQALEKTNWIKNRAAELLQIKRTTLVEKIKRYGINKEEK